MSTIVLSVVGALLAALLAAFVNWLRQPDWTRRHPGIVAALVVALALVGGGIGWWSEELRERRGTDRDAAGGPVDGTGPTTSTTSASPTSAVPDTSTESIAPSEQQSSPAAPAPDSPSMDRGPGSGSGSGVDGNAVGEGGRRWTSFADGRVQLPKVAGLELDADPARPVNGAGAGVDLRYSNDEALGMKLYAGPAFAVWDEGGVPDAEKCFRKLLSFPAYSEDPVTGGIYCVGTSEGRVARLQVEQAEYSGVTFRATVWTGSN